jgi:endonuclease/exonuclease/phosphatase family metal-dependent hydrolase
MRTMPLAAALLCACHGAPPRIAADVRPEDLALPARPVPPAVTLPDGIRVRAASLNCHGGQDASAEAIGAALRALDADVVGLQEADGPLPAAIAAAAGFAYVYGEGEALLSKTPLEEAQQVELKNGRSFASALTTISGVRFSVYSAHLGWSLSGLKQHREFADEVLAKDTVPHVLLIGDFNDEHGSPQIDALETQVVNAWTQLGWIPGDRISWPATYFDGTEGSQLIDQIFSGRALPALALDGDVIELSPPISDHKPVVATLCIRATSPSRATRSRRSATRSATCRPSRSGRRICS